MKKFLLLIFVPLFLFSCDNSDVDMDSKLYGIWVPKDSEKDSNKGGLIYEFNPNNTGKVYYIRQITPEGVFICDECLTVKLVDLTLKEINGRHELSMHKEDGGAFNNFYDVLNDNELKFTLGQHCAKLNNANIIEKKLSCPE